MPGDPNRPASEKQISALRKFGAKIPDGGLTISIAAEWMDYLIKKVQTGRQLDDKDRSGPPNFHPAASPSSSPPPAAKPAPAAAPPAPSPPPNGHDNGSPDPLPTSEGWITAQVQVVRDAKGSIVTVDRTAKIADHAFPGETHSAAMARLMAKAEKAVGL